MNIPKEEYINHPLYGRRILHFMSPVRWRGPLFEHEKCSNYKVLNKTVEWLPMCHHIILTPPNHEIPNNRDNVTLLPFDYAGSVTLNRGHLNAKEITRLFDFRSMDLDFVFNHQPELTYGIMAALQSKRYGADIKIFNLFHWVDTPQTKPSDVFPDGFIRQFEGIHLADKSLFHCEQTYNYLETNFTKTKRKNCFTGINKPYVDSKTIYMPLGISKFPEPEPFPLPKNKKILVFNHRWNNTTGIDKLVEYTKDLGDDYLVWVTDDNAKKPRSGMAAPSHFRVQSLPFKNYAYLLQKAYATLCFVDGYMTWNLSVQDGLAMNRPSLVYKHPTHKYILGNDYPLYFETKEEFEKLLNNLPSKFDWSLPPHDETFKNNLINAMLETLKVTKIQQSKYNEQWVYHILKDNGYKQNILYNTHPDLYSSNVWEGLRLYCMNLGIKDDPTSLYTRLFIPDDELRKKLEQLIDGKDFGDSKKDPEFHMNTKNTFWIWS
jgi:hypothetical protein